MLLRILGLLALLICVGCGRTAGLQSAAPPQGLPAPSELRSASDSLGYFTGYEYDPARPSWGTSSSETKIFEPSTSGSPKFWDNALSVFHLPVEDEGPLVIRLSWNLAPPAGAMYLALGNLSTDRWDWRQLSDPAAEITAENFADYISPEGSVLLTLLLPAAPSAAGPHNRAELDYIRLETRPQSGWRHLELFSAEIPAAEFAASHVVEPFTYQGRPGVGLGLYNYVEGSYVLQAAYLGIADSVSGLQLSDWQSYPAEVMGNWPVTLAGMGSGLAAAWFEEPGPGETTELHYGYCSDPQAGFGDELIYTNTYQMGQARLAEIGGLPGIAVGVADIESSSYWKPFYAASDAQSGGSWTIAAIDNDIEMSKGLSDSFSDLLDYQGRPIIACDSGASNLVVAAADIQTPLGPDDWTRTPLEYHTDNILAGVILDDKPLFAALDYIVFAPDEITFWTYAFSGSDLASPADWTVTHHNDLGLGSYLLQYSFAAHNGDLLFLGGGANESNGLLRSGSEPMRLWRNSDPLTTAGWGNETISSDPKRRCDFLVIDGQLGVLSIVKQPLGYFEGKDTLSCKLVWSVLVP